MGSTDPTPRLLAIYCPLKLTILNWKGDEEQWLEGPSTLPGQRRIPWGREVFLEQRDFVSEKLVANNGDGSTAQLLAGTNVRLRHSYVVCLESFREDELGNVAEVLGRCNYDSLGVPTALDGVGQGPKVVSWVHASSRMHIQVPLVEGPANFVATYWPQGKSSSVPESTMLCEPWLSSIMASGYADSSPSKAAGPIQLERLGQFRICPFQGHTGDRCDSDRPKYALQCLAAWLPKFCTAPKPGKRQRVPESVLAAAAAEAAARKEAMQKASREDFSLEEPLLMVCACDRWDRVLALDLQEAWRGTDTSIVEVAPALFRVRGQVPACPCDEVLTAPSNDQADQASRILPQGTFDRTCVWHAAGVRRCLQLLTLPSRPAQLIEAVVESKLNFPGGWSLEHEGSHPVRYESLAPYTQSSGFLAASLGRSISGPMIPMIPMIQGDRDESTESTESTAATESTRLVTVEMINSQGLHFLARDSLDRHGFNQFNPAVFGSIWRSRPYPDYSAALEPLAALALVGIGLRVHHRLTGKDPHAFLDVTCGTGTVAAAAKYCVSTWQIFAGDVNPTMSKRSLSNLQAAFPGQAYELLDEPSTSDPSPGLGVRQWDATNPWPIPSRACVANGSSGGSGDGLLVASNLPWGKSLDTQVEAATQVARCLAAKLPRATLCLIAPEEVGRNCSDWFRVLHSAPAGKKAVLIVGHGIAEAEKDSVLDCHVLLCDHVVHELVSG